MTAPSKIASNIVTATSRPPLLDRLRQMLEQSERADFAVGYLFLSGFHEVAGELEGRRKIRVLVGRTDRPTLEAVAGGLQQAEALQARVENGRLVKRSEREAQAVEAVATIGEGVSRLPPTEGAARDVARLRDLIGSGKLEMKTYPGGMLHAKAYICWYPEGRVEVGSAIVGSSNFTLAGFEGNTELNVQVQQNPDVAALGEWFDDLWKESVDISDEVLVELNRSWPLAQTSPYQVYLKTLYELYHDELGLPPLEPAKRETELANFQMDAVRHALGMIDRHGGCFIGDVVGLGKTHIGAEIVRQLQLVEPPGSHPLIVCPAGLVAMWQRISELYGLGAAVVSMSALRPPAGLIFDEEAGEFFEGEGEGPGIDLAKTYPNRGVVLVDEAHNFRNVGTRRYQALFDYLWSGEEHKIILLSATPQNLGPRDIYNQLRLFLDEVDHGLDIDPIRLDDYFAAVQRWYDYQLALRDWNMAYKRWQLDHQKSKGKRLAPPKQPEQPSAPFADITNVLLPVFIRRRRKDITELYGESAKLHGKPIRFPAQQLQNLEYRLDRVYAEAFSFEELFHQLKRHSGARYRALDYLKPEAGDDKKYDNLRRARSRVAALTRFLLVKRLESSVAAFRSTLGVLARSNRNFRSALTQGYVPIGSTATNILAGHEFDAGELLDRLRDEERKAPAKRGSVPYPATDFQVDRWIEDLDKDYEILQSLLEPLERISPEDDDKLQRLKAFLAQPEVKAGKVLIFSEAEATIEYLYQQLNPGDADPSIAKLSGSNRDHLTEIVKRFAPKANLARKERRPGPEIRILLATDVVSEGQNLQDCNRVLNYDLHWNPVRIIQRFGRVDRIGTEHQTIYLHNTWPDTEVDKQLALMPRLLKRIQAFHDLIGLDNQLLSDAERMNPAGMFAIYEEKRLPDEADDALDQVSAHQRGINLLQQLERGDPKLWQTVARLPDGIRAALLPPDRTRTSDVTRFVQAIDTGSVQMPLATLGALQLPLGSPEVEVGLRTPLDAPRAGETVVLLEQNGVRLAYAVDSGYQPRRITEAQLVSAITCEKGAEAEPLPADTNQRVMAAYQQARRDLAQRLGKDRRPGSETRLRRYLRRQFRLLRDLHKGDDEELRRIGILRQVFPDEAPQPALQALEEMCRLGLDGDILLRRLEALRDKYRLNPPGEDDVPGTAVGVLRIVCSEGLV